MSLFSVLIVILICIICSAIFSAAETAITTISIGKMKSLQSDRIKNADKVISIRHHSDKFLSTILIANNLANILASSIAATYLSQNFGEEAVFYSTAAMTLLLIIFAELLPKTLALRNAENLSLKLASFLHFLMILLTPVSIVIRFIVNNMTKVMWNGKNKEDISALEELRGTLRFHSDLGNVNKHDLHMLEGLLDLEDITLKEIMIHRKYIYSADIDQPVAIIVSGAFASGYSKIPLWQGKQDNIVAVLDIKLLLKLISQDPDYSKLHIEDVSKKPWFVPQTMSLKNQLASFREKCDYFAIVVDEYGQFKGVVTLRDIIEEIVGILQEEEIAESTMTKAGDGYLVSADYSIRDFVRLSDFDISDEISTTVGGIVVNMARRIPEQDDELIFKNYKFTIVEKIGKKLGKILISPMK